MGRLIMSDELKYLKELNTKLGKAFQGVHDELHTIRLDLRDIRSELDNKQCYAEDYCNKVEPKMDEILQTVMDDNRKE